MLRNLGTSRSDFRWGNPAAYRSAINNGWLKEMTWLRRPQNYNLKWIKETVLEESKKYKTRGEFKKVAPSAYTKARVNDWLIEMTWLSSNRNK